MGRPRLDIGTYGKIHTVELGPKRFEARAKFRLRNGRIARPRRRGESKAAAERALKKHLATLADEVKGKAVNPDTRFGHVMDLWLADFASKVERGDRAPKSLYDYTASSKNLIKRMGELACREVTAGLCDEVLKDIRDKLGYAAAKHAKNTLSGACGYAVRHEAMPANPARSVEALSRGKREPVRALEPAERADFLAKLREWVDAKAAGPELGVRARAWTDLPDLAEVMLATGCRIGEALALTAEDVDPTAKTVAAGHHLVRVAREGMVRVEGRKGGQPGVTLRVPSWSLPLLRQRKLASGGGPLFPTWNGTWLDPGNVAKRLAKASEEIGYGWVSSRMFRHTTATHLGDADVSASAIADQLGNTAQVVEKHYRRKRVANVEVAEALEDLMDG